VDADTSMQKGKILAKVTSSDELIEKLKREIENSFDDLKDNRINYEKLVSNVQAELRKIKHLLISNKAFKEKIFNKISKDDKNKYNLLNDILRKLINESSKSDVKKINAETLTKITELSKPKVLEKLNTEMAKHNRAILIPSPSLNKKHMTTQVTSTMSPIGRNLDRHFSEQQYNSSANKSYSIPKYVPLNERLPVVSSNSKI